MPEAGRRVGSGRARLATHRRPAATVVAAVLVGVVLVTAGCFHDGNGKTARDPGSIAAEAIAAVREERSAHYRLDVSFELRTNGDVESTRLEQLANTPIDLRFEGDLSSSALTSDASARFRGLPLAARLLAGPRELFLRFMDEWYGTRRTGLRTLERLARDELARRLGVAGELADGDGIGRRFPQLFAGTVSDGPELDGTATRQFRGRLDLDGIERLRGEVGQPPLTPEERAWLGAVSTSARIVVVVGDEDSLPRAVTITVDARPATLASLRAAGAPALTGIASLTATLELRLSDWGRDVSYERPRNVAPLEVALGRFAD